MRDPTRETPRLHERQAGLDLLVAAENGKLSGVVAHQVTLEFAEHDQSVRDEADRALKKLRGQIDRVNQLSAILGAPGPLNLFGGPASPCGYVRMGLDRRDPWEAAERKPRENAAVRRKIDGDNTLGLIRQTDLHVTIPRQTGLKRPLTAM